MHTVLYIMYSLLVHYVHCNVCYILLMAPFFCTIKYILRPTNVLCTVHYTLLTVLLFMPCFTLHITDCASLYNVRCMTPYCSTLYTVLYATNSWWLYCPVQWNICYMAVLYFMPCLTLHTTDCFSQFFFFLKEPLVSIKDIAAAKDDEVSPRNSNVSLAYNAILSSLMDLWKPIIAGEKWMASVKGSKARTNSRGDRGHPCLVPRCNGKWSAIYPFTWTRAFGAVTAPVYTL